MPATEIHQSTGWEDTSARFMARVEGNDGANILQSTIDTIACSVFDEDSETPNTATSTPAIVVADSVFDTLQTTALDSRWTVDTTGYNFAHDMPATSFPDGDHNYRIEYIFTPFTGDAFPLVFSHLARNLRSS